MHLKLSCVLVGSLYHQDEPYKGKTSSKIQDIPKEDKAVYDLAFGLFQTLCYCRHMMSELY